MHRYRVKRKRKVILAFDTLHAEGQRRYLETLRLTHVNTGTLQRPDMDHISGLSPIIAIEQKQQHVIRDLLSGQLRKSTIFCDFFMPVASIAYSPVTGNL